ncbi:MAG: endonuclease/exonuclease/phosphatase family protein [Burkholderiales bacterium]|nr:endonuclease/exonuclease/phosphatase family protein [Nitrosomonas sp.]MCP5244064.1 endonuclease/exonuclease/phosphatase family protein [Burkholderiales bacterium]
MTSLTLATYNIHRCIGSDGRFSFERVLSVIRELDADIIALQEFETRREGIDQLEQLSRHTGMKAIAGITMFSEHTHYGNALLSRLEIEQVRREDISVKGREPRGAIYIKTRLGKVSIQVVATHLGLLPGERLTQVKQLLKMFERKSADVSILMGDLNEWYLWGRSLRRLHAHFNKGVALATFPSQFPLLALDRIWIKPQSCLHSVTSYKTGVTRKASDHLPLMAKLIL